MAKHSSPSSSDIAPSLEEEPRTTASRRFPQSRLFVLVLWLLLAFCLFYSVSGDLTRERVSAVVNSAGVWGFGLYLLAFFFLQPLGLSAHILIIGSTLVWPWWQSLPLALVGTVGSGITSYYIGRYAAFEWVQTNLPDRLKKMESLLVNGGLWGVIVFRVMTFTTPPAQFMLGTTRVPVRTMILGSAIGFMPNICVDIFLGGNLLKYLF